MSIRSFFKPSAAIGDDDSVPAAKRARVSEALGGGGGAEKDVLASPAGSRSQHETPAKGKPGHQDSVVSDSNKSSTSDLTQEQLEKIAQNKAIALERRKANEAKTAAAGGAPLPTVEAKTVRDAALTMPAKWKEKLQAEFDKEYFKKLCDFHNAQVNTKKTIFPPTSQVFSAFYACDFDKISVVIVGQDPYHGPRQAHGLCFSVQKGVAIPPSLRNMYKELTEDPAIAFKTPNHGCLTKWAEQGVLLLNACLSVESGKANSHSAKGWEQFTDAVISACNKQHTGLVFLLWGAPAAKKCAAVDMKKHTVLKAPHPSPLSAHRGFFGCRHFSKCNDQLKQLGRPTIDWQID